MERLILITNDDGYRAPGISALVEVAKVYGKVVIIAPERSWSAKSHSITLEKPIEVNETDYFGSGVKGYISTGTPVDNIKFGLDFLLNRKPDLILSGINHGPNYSINMYYSGTVSAAIEGAFHQIPSIAISVESMDYSFDLSLAKQYTAELIEFVFEHPLSTQMCLNLNVPAIDASLGKGLRFCRSARAMWDETYYEWTHPRRKQNYYWLMGKFYNFEPDNEETDLWAIRNGYGAVVPLNVDPTNYNILHQLKNEGLTFKNKTDYESISRLRH